MTTQNFHFLNVFHVTNFSKGVRGGELSCCVCFSVMKIDTHTLCFRLFIHFFYHTLNFVPRLNYNTNFPMKIIFPHLLSCFVLLRSLVVYVLPFFSANHHFHLLPWSFSQQIQTSFTPFFQFFHFFLFILSSYIYYYHINNICCENRQVWLGFSSIFPSFLIFIWFSFWFFPHLLAPLSASFYLEETDTSTTYEHTVFPFSSMLSNYIICISWCALVQKCFYKLYWRIRSCDMC